MKYEKITNKELLSIVDMYETVAPPWSDDHTETMENFKACKMWHRVLKAILKRNGYDPSQIFNPKK